MYILRSWRDSLSLLAPANLKLFVLVTLKSTFETYKVLFTRWVPIVTMLSMVGVTYVMWVFVGPNISDLSSVGLFFLFFLVRSVLAYLQVYIGYAASRPSIGLKSDAYFLRFWRHTCALMLVPLAIVTVYALIWIGAPALRDYEHLMALLMHCVFNIIILFFLDSDGSLRELCRSVVRALTMIVYNLPLMSILFAFEIGGVFGYQKLELYGTWWLVSMPFILSVFLINLYTNLYIKKTHEQPDLYFDVPK